MVIAHSVKKEKSGEAVAGFALHPDLSPGLLGKDDVHLGTHSKGV